MMASHEPALPNPWMATGVSSRRHPRALTSRSRQIAEPRPVAASRPRDPPRMTGLPVMTAGFGPCLLEYSSAIQPMIFGVVLTSGAGTSTWGPITSAMARMKARDRRSSSASDSSLGSNWTPPLPPPKGMFISAVFHVIKAEKHRISSRLTFGWNRSPPLKGPRALLYWTRYPLKTLKATEVHRYSDLDRDLP